MISATGCDMYSNAVSGRAQPLMLRYIVLHECHDAITTLTCSVDTYLFFLSDSAPTASYLSVLRQASCVFYVCVTILSSLSDRVTVGRNSHRHVCK